ncbi:LGFP repeat-containing protein [Nocardia goodfellowii]
MRSDCEEIPGGFTKEEADKAETLEAAALSKEPSPDGQPRLMVAPGCQMYWPAPYEVCGAIRDKYNELGGPNSFLLWPTSNEMSNPDGAGKRSTFQNGPIYWSLAGGAHPVVNHFFAAWQRNGWEGGVLGYPTSDEIVNPDPVAPTGRRQTFHEVRSQAAIARGGGNA